MPEQPFSRVIVSIALLACSLCVSQIPRHEMLPGGDPKLYRNQPGSRSQTFSRNPQNQQQQRNFHRMFPTAAGRRIEPGDRMGHESLFARFERTGASRSRRRKTTSTDYRALSRLPSHHQTLLEAATRNRACASNGHSRTHAEERSGGSRHTLENCCASLQDARLEDYCQMWESQSGVKLSPSTMSRTIRRAGYTRKKDVGSDSAKAAGASCRACSSLPARCPSTRLH